MQPHLDHYDEFKQILDNYQISDQILPRIKNLKMVLLMAATSTGRSVITRYLMQTGRYYYIVSDTTRPPQIRDGKLEENGVQYYFRKEEELLADLKAGKFLEAEIIHGQQVSGISLRELEKAGASGKIAFTETDIAGVRNIKQVKPDSFAIFLLPPSYQEWQSRLAGRGGMTEEEIRRRLITAAYFFEQAPKEDYFQYVVAEEPSRTAQIIDDIVAGELNPDQNRGKEILAQLQAVLKM